MHGCIGPTREEVGPVRQATSGRRRHPFAGFLAWHGRWDADSDLFHPSDRGYETWTDAFWSLIRSSGSGDSLSRRSERRQAGGCSG